MGKTYCNYCGRLVGESGKIYIADSICEGHTLSIRQYVSWKFATIRTHFFGVKND